jgi:hypothetical protein
VRGNGSSGKLLLVLACAAMVAGSATRNDAQASHCIITPTLAKATVGQGVPYARLVRGKETLVKAYLTLPATLPRCAGNTPAIKIIGATLTMKNGTTPLVTGLAALPDANGALITSKTTAKNQPADPKFVIPGSQLPPANSGIAGSFTASFELSVQYQSRGGAVQGNPDTFSSTQTVPFTTVSGSPISRPVEAPTKALRMLAVPMVQPLSTAMMSTLEAGLTALSGMYPVQDQTGSGQARVGVLPTTAGGIRYALNNPGIVDVGTPPFCGTSSNYASIQAQLQGFHNAFNDLNTTENDVDRTIGVVQSDLSTGSVQNPSCFEGFTATNTKEAWVRVVPDAPGVPSTTGSLLAMEVCHTFGCTTSTGTFHSLYTNADNLAENLDLAFNPLTWSWLSDDRSAMRFTGAGWNNTSTVFEKGDFGYLLCGLGGANTSGCPSAGAGTLTGVASGGQVFLLDGTTDGRQAGTRIRNSFVSTVQPETTPQATSAYRFLQKNSSGAVVSDLGVPVEFVHSGHSTSQDVGPGATGAFSFAFPFNSQTARIELVKRADTGTTLLYAAGQTAAPIVDSVEVVDDGPIILGSPEPSSSVRSGPSAASPRDSFDAFLATSGDPGTAVAGDVLTTASVGAASLDQGYVFNGKGGYSADGLGQDLDVEEPGGSIQADVPAGSTVEKAFLYGTYFGTLAPDEGQRTIVVDDSSVLTSKISDDGEALTTTRADVTGLVAAKVGTGGGVTNFAVNNDPAGLDGVGLVVVYSNSTLPETTIAILDGTASQTGDTTTFTYSEPLDKTASGFSATMSLGVGFGFQGADSPTAPGTNACGTGSPQSSLVDVNGTRLTSCAGNYDDGYGDNGGLITVGGVADSTANPTNPFQQPADGGTPRVTDDELYDIAPFTSQGDTQLTITTSNPSNDDNLFLAVVRVAAEAALGTPSSGTDVEVEATDDDPRNARATCYVDWGGIKYPFDVAIPPTSFDEVNDKAIFECSLDSDTIGATDAGNVNITAVVHDGFTQSAPGSTTTASTQTPPVASIAAPVDEDTFLQFETIILRGSALDLEQGHLTGSALQWTENSPAGPLSGGEEGEEVFLHPPPAGWTPGTYTVTLTATDATTRVSTDTVTFEILADADHDGIPVGHDFTTCSPPTPGDNNPENATADPDGDGIPNIDDQYTSGGTCVAETNYAAIIDWDPDDLNLNTSGTPITVKVRVPYRSVSQVVPSSVRITKVIYGNADGDIVEENYEQPAIEWTARGQDGTAKFARQPFIAFLNSRQIANQRIVVEVSGAFTTGTTWAGRDSTNVK